MLSCFSARLRDRPGCKSQEAMMAVSHKLKSSFLDRRRDRILDMMVANASCCARCNEVYFIDPAYTYISRIICPQCVSETMTPRRYANTPPGMMLEAALAADLAAYSSKKPIPKRYWPREGGDLSQEAIRSKAAVEFDRRPAHYNEWIEMNEYEQDWISGTFTYNSDSTNEDISL